MRLTRSKLIAASAAMAAVFAAVTIAEARPRAKHVAQGRPLTVQGRSFQIGRAHV